MKLKLKYIKYLLLLLLILPGVSKATFTISAEVENKTTINLSQKIVHDYFEDLTIYPKFFPDMVSVTDKGNNQSEWTYRVDYPLAEAWNAVFEQFKKGTSENLLFESNSTDQNYLKCNASFTSVSSNRTLVDIYIKVVLTREKASDIHFLAGVLGEKLISEKMKSKLDDDLQTFIDNISADIYKK
jgi:uncharacterized membrane protein